jgi:hypothetical protein
MDGGATVEFAAKLLVEGLRIGVGDGAGGAADVNQAMVRRMYRLLEGQHADCWRRAERIACALGLPTRDL